MALILAKCLPYDFVLLKGISRQTELDHLVLFVCEAVANVNQFLKVLGKYWLKYLQTSMKFARVTLSGSFKMFKFLKRLDVCAFLFKKCIVRRDFFCKTSNLLIELGFWTQAGNE